MDAEPRPRHESVDAYVESLHRRLGLEVASRREALGLSAYALAKAAGVTDQTILNLERGQSKNGCWTSTLARIAYRFGLSLTDLVHAAETRVLTLP